MHGSQRVRDRGDNKVATSSGTESLSAADGCDWSTEVGDVVTKSWKHFDTHNTTRCISAVMSTDAQWQKLTKRRLHLTFEKKQLQKWLERFSAHDSIYGDSGLYATACPPVCPSHGWISQKRFKLGSCNFHRTVAPFLEFLWVNFIQKF